MMVAFPPFFRRGLGTTLTLMHVLVFMEFFLDYLMKSTLDNVLCWFYVQCESKLSFVPNLLQTYWVFCCHGDVMVSFVPLCDRLWWMVTKVPCWWLIWNPTPSMSSRWGPSMQMLLGSQQLSRGKQVGGSFVVIPVCSLSGYRKKTHPKTVHVRRGGNG